MEHLTYLRLQHVGYKVMDAVVGEGGEVGADVEAGLPGQVGTVRSRGQADQSETAVVVAVPAGGAV